MDLEKKIIAFAKLGEQLRKEGGKILYSAIQQANKHNAWFTEENIRLGITSLGEMLQEGKIRKWTSKYQAQGTVDRGRGGKRIGVIMAGNIPMVGFHDFLCVLMSGNVFVGKLSSDDEFLLPAVSNILINIEPELKRQIHFASPLTPLSSRRGEGGEACNAYIATGSNNSARYFEYYFGKYPHVIRKNRNSAAILDGNENAEDLKSLGKDIFQYFGLGCRNVSKFFIPQEYNLDKFFEAIVEYGDVIHHNKYANNYNYYRTIYLMNNEKFLDNNFLMLKEDKNLASPVATLYYERYNSEKELTQKLEEAKEKIQCIVASPLLGERGTVRPGQTQSPELWDYADGVDTMKFLTKL